MPGEPEESPDLTKPVDWARIQLYIQLSYMDNEEQGPFELHKMTNLQVV